MCKKNTTRRVNRTLVAGAALLLCLQAPELVAQDIPMPTAAQKKSATTVLSQGQEVVLDRAISIINGDVILASDIDEELHYSALEPWGNGRTAQDPRVQALRHLISRTLIEQQRREDVRHISDPTDQEVQSSLAEWRRHMPNCTDCGTQKGWSNFLTRYGLTEQEVLQHWREREITLRYIEMRFREGVRVPEEDVKSYYDTNFAPRFVQQNLTPPPLQSVAPRIEEILLQQKVNVLLRDWLNSLREQGSVEVLDPAYAALAHAAATLDDDQGGE